MGMNNQGYISNGPTPGTPAPPTTPNPGADSGGRPTGSGSGGPDLGATVNKWKQGIFTPPAPAGTMPSPSSGGAGGAVSGGGRVGPPVSPQPAAGQPGQGVQAGPPTQGMVPGAPVVGQTVLPTVPQPHEVDALPPGSYETPVGTLIKAADGTAKVRLNPAGEQQYRQRFAESLKAFGPHPFDKDPNAPPPPINPGGVSYNPFTNQWSGQGITPSAPGVR